MAVDRFAYRSRNRVERTFSRTKNARRMVARYDRTAASYLGFVQVTAVRPRVRRLNNAP